MDIEDYNSLNENNVYNIYQPPILPIKQKSNILENKNLNENKHNYKLYRKNPKNSNNNIYDTMNLKCDKQ